MRHGKDYDVRELSFQERGGSDMGATVRAIKLVTMAELCRPRGKAKKKSKRTTEKATRRKKDAR